MQHDGVVPDLCDCPSCRAGVAYVPKPPRDEQPKARELLRSLRSGYAKGPEAFDRLVLRREPSTIRRWLRGQSPIPKAVLAFLYNAGRQVKLDNSEPVSHVSDPINEGRD
jgi:hypothetical protein